MANKDESKPGASGLNTTQKILIGGFACIIIAIIVIAVMVFRPGNTVPDIDPQSLSREESRIITPENYEEVRKQAQILEDTNTFYVSMNPDWTFENSEAFSEDAIMENSELNSSDMYITVELEGTGEVVYESPVMPAGSSLENIKLNTTLEPGTHSAICVHHVLYPDGTEETTVNMAVKLHILN